jgi:hypothetical protein
MFPEPALAGGPYDQGYTKREMAADLVELMASLGTTASPSSATIAARGSRTGWRSTIRRRSPAWP